jgi:hypothetical protein
LTNIVGVVPTPLSIETLAVLGGLLLAQPISIGFNGVSTENLLKALRVQAAASPVAAVDIIVRASRNVVANLDSFLGPSLLNDADIVDKFYRGGTQIIIENFPKVVDNDVRAATILHLKELARLPESTAPNARPFGAAIRNINAIAVGALDAIARQPVPKPRPLPTPSPIAPTSPLVVTPPPLPPTKVQRLSTGQKIVIISATLVTVGAIGAVAWTVVRRRRRY